MRNRPLLFVVVVLMALVLLPSAAVAKTKTKIAVSLSSTIEHADFTPTITGQLKTSRGKAIKKTTVYLYRDGVRVASAKTNSKGKVTFEAATSDDSNTALWTIRFSGDRKYKASNSPAKRTDCDIDGQTFEAGRSYYMSFDQPVSVMVGYPMGSGFVSGSDGVPVYEFWFSAPTTSPYVVFLDTEPAWGGGASMEAMIW